MTRQEIIKDLSKNGNGSKELNACIETYAYLRGQAIALDRLRGIENKKFNESDEMDEKLKHYDEYCILTAKLLTIDECLDVLCKKLEKWGANLKALMEDEGETDEC